MAGSFHENPAAQSILIPVAAEAIAGDLVLPETPRGLVLFAHGSGSGRFSPRNRYVAQQLQAARLGTLLLDLLTMREESKDLATGGYRFDIPLLALRLIAATDWVLAQAELAALPLGYFGASTGAAAALIAAADYGERINAVVSRGGRPDLASTALARVESATLLIVGGHDTPVIELNQLAYAQMRCPKQLEIVPAATHLFEEPGALEQVATLARAWFLAQFSGQAADQRD